MAEHTISRSLRLLAGLVLVATTATVLMPTAPALAVVDDQVDPTFGIGGSASLPSAMIVGLSSDAQDRVYVLDYGNSETCPANVSRYDRNGLLDATYGIGGVATDQVSPNPRCFGNGAVGAARPDGSYWFVSQEGPLFEGNFSALVGRYDPSGQLDTTWADNGLGQPLPGFMATEVVEDATGGILLKGVTNPGQQATWRRLASDGTVDDDFAATVDGDGIIVRATQGVGRSALALADGRWISYGVTLDSTGFTVSATVARHLIDGHLDSTFGTDGVVRFDDSLLGGVRAVAPTSDGGLILIVQAVTCDPACTVDRNRLIRLDSAGTVMTGWGNGGMVDVPSPNGMPFEGSIAVGADGTAEVRLVGLYDVDPDSTMWTPTVIGYRVDATGSLDTTRGTDGLDVLTTPNTTGDDQPFGMVVQTDLSVVTLLLNGTNPSRLVRFRGDTDVPYDFTGFLAPVDPSPRLNRVDAGSTVPMRFSLGGDLGLDVLAPGAPTSHRINCSTAAATGLDQPTASHRGLRYRTARDRYVYRWSTERRWSGQCREFVLTLDDGSVHTARFRFT